MSQLSPLRHDESIQLRKRLNRVLGEINVVLLAVAIGLAVLDLTCFVTLQVSMEMPHPESGTNSRMFAGDSTTAP